MEADAAWVTLHVAGLQLTGASTPAPDAAMQSWGFDSATFTNGEVPGDTRYFALRRVPGEYLRVLRWTFLHPQAAKAFSLNLSGVMVFGTTLAMKPEPEANARHTNC